jgi:TetR/AcrR family transcriptional regulator, regulator of cefoperazone and chloramphenicol sensitivity
MLMPKARFQHPHKRRHPPTGGYARGDETRAKIVAAALEVFGTYGFAGASTRLLAEKAGVNLPALQYYFDGKAGVYLACAEHIAQRLEARLGPIIKDITHVLASEAPSREHLFALLHGFLDTYADLLVGEREVEDWVLFIIREQAHPTKAFDIIFDRVFHRAVRTCAMLVGPLLDLPSGDPKVLVRALAFIGQVLFFRTAREAVLRIQGWPDFKGDRLALVKSALREQVTAALGGAARTARRKRS